MKTSDALIAENEYDNALAEMEDYYGMGKSMQNISESDIPQSVGAVDEEWDAMREAFLGQAIEAEAIIINVALTLEALLRAAERLVVYIETEQNAGHVQDVPLIGLVMEFRNILDYTRRIS